MATWDSDSDDDSFAASAGSSANRSAGGPIRIQGLAKVLEYLYLGDAYSASKLDVLREQGITHVINCVDDVVDNFYDDEGLEYLSFALGEGAYDDASAHFESTFEFIKGVRDAFGDDGKSKVLVHCERGQNQSAAIILAYMLQSAKEKGKNLTLQQAHKYVQGKKSNVQINRTFLKQLIALEKELYGEVSMRVAGGRKGKGRGKGRGGKKSSRGRRRG